MPEEAMNQLRDGLRELDIEVCAVTSHACEAPVVERAFPQSLHYHWAAFRTLRKWDEPFDALLYERVIGPHRSEALPIVERYGPFEGGSIEAETRLMHDFSRADFLINTCNPDVLLFAKEPESGLEYMLYRIGKERGIKTIFSIGLGCLQHLQAAGTELHEPLLDEDWSPAPHVIPLNEEKDKGQGLHPKTIEMIERIRSEESTYIPDYMKGKIVDKPFLELVRTLGQRLAHPRGLYSDLLRRQDGPLFKYSLLKRYAKFAISYDQIDWKENTIYFPLHYQPELTTMPLGGPYVNQVRVIKMLSDHTPPETRILVKEHNSQFGFTTKGSKNFRPRNYYQWIASIPKVQIIERSVPSGVLQNQADITAVITGTAGFEAMVRGKPVIAFGNGFYLNGPGVIHVHNAEDIGRLDFSEMPRFLGRGSESVLEKYLLRLECLGLKGDVTGGLNERVSKRQVMYKNALIGACRKLFL